MSDSAFGIALSLVTFVLAVEMARRYPGEPHMLVVGAILAMLALVVLMRDLTAWLGGPT